MTIKRIKTYSTYHLDGTVKALPNQKGRCGAKETRKTAQRKYHEYHRRNR